MEQISRSMFGFPARYTLCLVHMSEYATIVRHTVHRRILTSRDRLVCSVCGDPRLFLVQCTYCREHAVLWRDMYSKKDGLYDKTMAGMVRDRDLHKRGGHVGPRM